MMSFTVSASMLVADLGRHFMRGDTMATSEALFTSLPVLHLLRRASSCAASFHQHIPPPEQNFRLTEQGVQESQVLKQLDPVMERLTEAAGWASWKPLRSVALTAAKVSANMQASRRAEARMVACGWAVAAWFCRRSANFFLPSFPWLSVSLVP